MEIIFLLIGISVVFIFIIARLFFWAVKSGQYDDLEGPRHQILLDDDDTTGGDASSPEQEEQD
jgi:cbb3-type cytochrome oxidase maturation protein